MYWATTIYQAVLSLGEGVQRWLREYTVIFNSKIIASGGVHTIYNGNKEDEATNHTWGVKVGTLSHFYHIILPPLDCKLL